MTEHEFDEVFEIETLQDWQMSAGQVAPQVEEPAGGGCNSNSTNNN